MSINCTVPSNPVVNMADRFFRNQWEKSMYLANRSANRRFEHPVPRFPLSWSKRARQLFVDEILPFVPNDDTFDKMGITGRVMQMNIPEGLEPDLAERIENYFEEERKPKTLSDCFFKHDLATALEFAEGNTDAKRVNSMLKIIRQFGEETKDRTYIDILDKKYGGYPTAEEQALHSVDERYDNAVRAILAASAKGINMDSFISETTGANNKSEARKLHRINGKEDARALGFKFVKEGGVSMKKLAEDVAEIMGVDSGSGDAMTNLVDIMSKGAKTLKEEINYQGLKKADLVDIALDYWQKTIGSYRDSIDYSKYLDQQQAQQENNQNFNESDIYFEELEKNLPPEDVLRMWNEMSYESAMQQYGYSESTGTTVRQYFKNGPHEVLGVSDIEEIPDTDSKGYEYLKKYHPEELYRINVRREFFRRCGLTKHELNELSEDLAQLMHTMFDDILYDDSYVQAMKILFPTVFTTATVKKIKDCLLIPEERRYNELVKALGTKIFMNILRTRMLGNRNMSDVMKEKMQVFNDPDFKEDFFRILMTNANPYIKNIFGFVYNTKIESTETENDSNFFDEYDETYGEDKEGALQDVQPEESENEEESNESERSRGDFIKKDSLTKSHTDSLDKEVKRVLSTMIRGDEKSVFGNPKRYSFSEASRLLIRVVSDAKNGEEMKTKIYDSNLPFKGQLLFYMERHPEFKSNLFANFKKNTTKYVKVSVADVYSDAIQDTIRRTRFTNLNSQGDAGAEDSIRVAVVTKKGKSLFYVPDLIANEATQKDYILDVSAAKNVLDELSNVKLPQRTFYKYSENIESEIRNKYKDSVEHLMSVLEYLGFSGVVTTNELERLLFNETTVINSETGLPEKVFDLSLINSIVTSANSAVKLITTNGDMPFSEIDRNGNTTNNRTWQDFKKQLEKIADAISVVSKSTVESGANSNGKTFYSYTNSNYMGRLFETLNNFAERKTYIEENYANTTFFSKLFQTEAAMKSNAGALWTPLSWITDAYYSNEGEVFEFKTLSDYNGKKYNQMSDSEYVTSVLAAFKNSYISNGVVYTNHIIPVLSDKSRTGFIVQRLLGNGEILTNLVAGVLKCCELNRMNNVVERARARQRGADVEFIKGFDVEIENGKVETGKGGMRFVFMHMFNPYLDKINDDKACMEDKLAAWIHDNVYGDDKYKNKGVYNSEKISRLIIGDKDAMGVLTTHFEAMVQKFINGLLADGTYNIVKNNVGIANDADFIDFASSFIYNNFYANTQFYLLTTGDLAFYKNANDIIKRSSEFISDGLVQDTTAWKRDHVLTEDEKYQKAIILEDMKGAFRDFDGITKILDERKKQDLANIEKWKEDTVKANTMPKKEVERIYNERKQKIQQAYERRINHYREIEYTDGQGFISFKYYDNMLHALGRGKDMDIMFDEYSFLYDKFAELFNNDTDYENQSEAWKNEFHALYAKVEAFNEKYKYAWEVVKPFTYTQLIRNGMKIPFQVKDAQAPLLDLQTMMDEAKPDGDVKGDATMARLAAYMHVNNIDTVLFKSNIKVGAVAVNKVDTSSLVAGLDKITSDSANIIRIPITDVMLQNETPSHFEDMQIPLGVQLKNMIFGPFAGHEQIADSVSYVEDENGNVKRVVESMTSIVEKMAEYDSLMANRIVTRTNKAMDKIGLSDENEYERNYKISKMIIRDLETRGEADMDSDFRFSVNGDCKFNIPLSEPTSRKAAGKMLASIVKRSAIEVDMPGGQMVQVTDGFRFQSGDTSLERDKSLRIAYYKKDGSITYKAEEGVGVAYFEAELPYFYKDMYNADGKLDERLSRLIMYRIPTEGSCSVFPVKVVKWSKKITGGIVKLPAEVPGIGGMDFDIDKLFFFAPSIAVERKKGERKKKLHYVTREYAESHKTPANDDKADCNRIFEIMWNVLTSPQNMSAMMIPSNFFELKRQKYIFSILKDEKEAKGLSEDEMIKRYNELEKLGDKELQVLSDNIKTDGVCDFTFQKNTSQINNTAGQLIGVFANANSQHVYMQGRGAALYCYNVSGEPKKACYVNGNKITMSNEFDPVFAQDGYTRITENISQFLAAAADAVKEPTLYQLNVNMFTVNLGCALLRCGFDIETVSLILQQPVVVRMSKMYNREAATKLDDEYIDLDKIYNTIIKERTGKWYGRSREAVEDKNRSMMCSNINITKDDLVKYIGRPMSSMQKTGEGEEGQFRNDQWQLFSLIYGFLKSNESIRGSNRTLKMDNASQRHGTEMFEYVDILDKEAQKAEDIDSSVKGFPDITIPVEKSEHKRLSASYACQREVFDAFCYLFDKHFSSFMNYVNNNFNFMNSRPNPNSKILGNRTYNIYDDYTLFNFTNDKEGSNSATFNETDRDAVGFVPTNSNMLKYMLEKFPQEAKSFRDRLVQKQEYSDNVILKRLKFEADSESGTVKIYIPGKSISDIERLHIKDDFSALINDEDRSVSEFAMTLWLYNIYHTGFSSERGAFIQYMPATELYKMKNYIEFFRNVENGKYTPADASKFEQLYSLNYPELLSDSGKIEENMKENTFTAVRHRRKIDYGTYIAAGGGKLYAVRMNDNYVWQVAPLIVDDVTDKAHTGKDYNLANLPDLNLYIFQFNIARNYYERYLNENIDSEEIETENQNISNIELTDEQVMEITESFEFKGLKKMWKKMFSTIEGRREALKEINKFC